MNKLRRRKGKNVHVETGPLSDILFFLLIFFLMNASVASFNAIKLDVPNSTLKNDIKKEYIKLTVVDMGTYLINEKKTSNYKSDLLKLKNKSIQQIVLIEIDKSNNIQNLVNIVTDIQDLGMKSVLATKK